jgi:peptidyl-tRNA hydrolase
VLAPFREEERALVPPVVEAARDCAFDAAAAGLTQAMNRWNRFGREATDT